MEQPTIFLIGDLKYMMCKLDKSHCTLYHKFHEIILSFSFERNLADGSVYHGFSLCYMWMTSFLLLMIFAKKY